MATFVVDRLSSEIPPPRRSSLRRYTQSSKLPFIEANQIHRVQPLDDQILEEWERLSEESEQRAIYAVRLASQELWPWQVHVAAAGFIRSGPASQELADSLTDIFRAIPGVRAVLRDDTEV